jgi:hypothetical protein
MSTASLDGLRPMHDWEIEQRDLHAQHLEDAIEALGHAQSDEFAYGGHGVRLAEMTREVEQMLRATEQTEDAAVR